MANRAGEHPAEEDELVGGLKRAGFVADGVDQHLFAALNADQQAGAAVVAVFHEHLAELGEVAPNQVLWRRPAGKPRWRRGER